MHRRLSLIALVLVIVFALVFWLRRGEKPDAVDVPDIARTPAAATSTGLVSLPESPASASRTASRTNEGTVEPVEASATPTRTGVRVRAVALEDGRPLPKIQVQYSPNQARPSQVESDGSQRRTPMQARTDANGFAEIEAEPGVTFSLTLFASEDNAGSSSVSVDPALASGEFRDIVVRLPAALDIDLRGRVTDRETGAPIVGARVGRMIDWGMIDEEDARFTGADGRFRAQGATWKRSTLVVLAAGYELAVVALVTGHDSQANEVKVELSRGASLRVTVRDASNAVMSGLRITLSTAQMQFGRPNAQTLLNMGMFQDATWSAETGADGVAEFAELPPRMPLGGVVSSGKREVFRAADPVTLQPQEARSVEWKIVGGSTIHGVVREMDGRTVAGQPVCMQPARGTGGTYLRPTGFSAAENRRMSKSNAEGRFTFEDVTAGDWVIGPPPGTRKSASAVAPDEPAPFGQHVHVAPGTNRVDVEVRVQRGLTIRGRVLEPTGSATKSASIRAIRASADGGRTHVFESVRDKEGGFVLGPLIDGEYEITALGGTRFGSSDPVRARPGDTNVVLQLRAGGTLSGVIEDKATGLPCKARFFVQPRDPGPWGMRSSDSDESGSFETGGLAAGLYDLCATTTNGRFGMLAGIEVSAAATVDGLRIEVEPGASVRVRYDGPREFVAIHVLAGGIIVVSDGAEKGSAGTFTVPAGRIVVRATHPPKGENFDLPLTLEVGETRDIVFDGAWK